VLDRLDVAPLAPVVREELARRRLLDFARLVYPGFEAPPHIAMLADLLERIERGEIRKLMISLPVRHGKSVIASQLFPAWFVGRHPERDVILASHSEDLAVRNSRVAKSLTQDDRWPFDVRLASDSASVGRWNTTARGGCYAIGVGGAITGRGANLLIVDDALHDGLSEAECASAFSWFTEVAVPRVEPGGAIIMIGARFSEQDLCGQILASEDGKNWTVVNLPAIAEEDDPLGRAPGEALWPERFPLAELEERRVSMGSRAFGAQFQQQPVSLTGGMFKRAWFQNRYDALPERPPEDLFSETAIRNRIHESSGVYDVFRAARPNPPLVKVQAIDCASKTGVFNDYSAIVTLACDGPSYYIVDVVRERLEFTDLLARVVAEYRKHRPSRVFVEDASAGIAIVQQLRRQTRVPVIPVPAKGSKISRAEAATPVFESGRVLLPKQAPWIDDYINEFASFPGGRHDDQVDATLIALKIASAIISARFERQVLRAQLGADIINVPGGFITGSFLAR
jgi:predicted phage terminase large subunit-like protein